MSFLTNNRFTHLFKTRNKAGKIAEKSKAIISYAKLVSMPKDSFEIFRLGPKSKSFKIITKEDLKKHGKFPENKS